MLIEAFPALREKYRDAILTLVAAALALVLLAIAYSSVWPLTIDIGDQDSRFIDQVVPTEPSRGFHATELFNGVPMRWTSETASVAIPYPPPHTRLMTLRLLNSRPADQPDPQVTINLDGRRIGDFAVARTSEGARTYRLLAPGGLSLNWAARLNLQVETITLPNDPRLLGIVVDQVSLAPMSTELILPSLWWALGAAMLGAIGYALPRSAGLQQFPSLTIALVLTALIAWAIVARPAQVLPFLQRIVALLGLGCLGIWVTRMLAHSQADPEGRLVVCGTDLPLYLAVAWWLGPIFQLIMTADGAINVTPPPRTAWIGGALLVLLVGLLVNVYLLRGRWAAADITRWALIIFAVVAVAHLLGMLLFAFSRQAADFWIFFKGTREWARGGALYDIHKLTTDFYGHVFKVPPFFALLLLPFVSLPGEDVLFYYRVLDTILLVVTALIWFRMWGLKLWSAAGLGTLLLLNFRPFTDTIQFGQVDLVLLCTLTLALWMLREERDLLAGMLVAFGSLLKLYPMLLLAFFVIKRRWGALAGFVLGMLLCSTLSIAVMGWEVHWIYLTQVFPISGNPTAWVENQAIAGFLARFIAPPAPAVALHSPAIRLMANGLAGLCGLLACYLALQPAKPKTTTYTLQYSAFLLLMLLSAPAAWMHYETLLFIPFGALLLHFRDRMVGLGQVVLLAVSFSLIGYGNTWSFYDGTVMGILTIASLSYKFYGMLLLGGLLVSVLLKERVQLHHLSRPMILSRSQSG